MGLKYYNEFRGLDNILNRIEIHDKSSVTTREVTAGESPFVIEYNEAKKLEAIQVSGARLNLISKTNLEFLDLHTDNMQKYLVRFYRGGSLFWLGWLDSELYSESFTDVPPYNVEFSASDFNILERLKFLDSFGNKYMDIQPLSVQLKRCFDLLELPFEKMYIGCSTVAEGVPISGSESVLHTMYIQSRNFYDEEGEPMSCRDVVSSILEPFGLVLVQRDASIYIFDYNTIKGAGVFKAYNYSDMQYVGDDAVSLSIVNVNDIGIAGQESALEFEEMINNVKITSSIYADPSLDTHEVTEENVSNLLSPSDDRGKRIYANAAGWMDTSRYIIFQSNNGGDVLAGADFGKSGAIKYTIPIYRGYILSGGKYRLNLKAKIYVNTRANPFSESNEPTEREKECSVVLRTYARLYITDENGVPKKYARFNRGTEWRDVSGEIPYETPLYFLSSELNSQSSILNKWASLRGYGFIPQPTTDKPEVYSYFNGSGSEGQIIPIRENSGMLVMEMKNEYDIYNPGAIEGSSRNNDQSKKGTLNQGIIKDVLLNDIKLSIYAEFNKEIGSAPDVEFDSYINKAVKSNLEEKNLYVVSANEDAFVMGYGLLLGKADGTYFSQTSFTRSGQTDILERLLMCTIHSNFAPKNMKLSVIIKGCDNPAMRTATATPLLQGEFLITGCILDFAQANTKIIGVHYSEDTAKLSDIPYV